MDMFTLSDQALFNLIVGVTGSIVAFLLKVLWGSIRQLQRDVVAIRVDLPQNYVQKDELRALIVDVKETINSRFGTLDAKFAAIFKKLDRMECEECRSGSRRGVLPTWLAWIKR